MLKMIIRKNTLTACEANGRSSGSRAMLHRLCRVATYEGRANSLYNPDGSRCSIRSFFGGGYGPSFAGLFSVGGAAERDEARAGGDGDERDAVGGIIDDEHGGLVGQTAVDDGVARMGMTGDEAVVQPHREVLPLEVVGHEELIDVLPHPLLLAAREAEAPVEKEEHDGKHGDKHHGRSGKERFVGILGFSHGGLR